MVAATSLIAVVDDEPAVRTMLGRVLRLGDFEVAPFASGQDFLSSIEACRPACAVIDIHMPGLSGFDVQTRLRLLPPPIPVVFVTASDDRDLDAQAKALHVDCVLRKPFTANRLHEAVARAMAAHDRSSD